MSKVRTRFAPSPTGFMHVGNLRTALYEYLVAKSQDGVFVLRIEDTDRERYVEGAVDVIYNTMKTAGLVHDEGPDIGGQYGPYVQSERMGMFKEYAEDYPQLAAMYDEATSNRLMELSELLDGRRLYDLNFREITELSNVVGHFEKIVSDANEEFDENRKNSIKANAMEMHDTMAKMEGRKENYFNGILSGHFDYDEDEEIETRFNRYKKYFTEKTKAEIAKEERKVAKKHAKLRPAPARPAKIA